MIRCPFYEVYEQGSDYPLLVTTDVTHAREVMEVGDRMAAGWWVKNDCG